MHKVAILALNDFVALDLAIAVDVFGQTVSAIGEPLYDTAVYGAQTNPRGSWFALSLDEGLSALQRADTIIIPGITNFLAPIDSDLLAALRLAASRGARLASVCTGSFILAAAGLLDGLKATTHWRAIDDLARRFPKITVERDVLFIDNGSILTSAGVTSGVDLCLHMIRKDHGAEVAANIAKMIVMPLERDGRQPQLINHATPDSNDNLTPLLFWLTENLHHKLSVEDLAGRAKMSPRTFNRKFREQTGTTPLQWLLTARVRRAQQLLETTGLTVENVATAVGFDSASSFRERFQRSVGASPTCWRNTYARSGLQPPSSPPMK